MLKAARSLNRRSFFLLGSKALAVILASPLFTHVIAWAEDLKLIDMSEKKRKDPVNQTAVKSARQFKYIVDAKKEKRELASDKKGPSGKTFKPSEQFCNNCSFYVEKEKGKAGTCQVIPGVLVHDAGWCMMWNAKS